MEIKARTLEETKVYNTTANIKHSLSFNQIISNILTILNTGEDVEQKELLIHCWWECKMVQQQ